MGSKFPTPAPTDPEHRKPPAPAVAPAPSDVKGEEHPIGTSFVTVSVPAYNELLQEIKDLKSRASLTPLTDPSVRGVLVQCVPDEETTGLCGEFGLRGSFKLRPASEFGVAAREDGARSAMSRRELEQRHEDAVRVHHDLQKLAESIGVELWDVAGTGLLVRLVKERVDQLVAAPGEPGLKCGATITLQMDPSGPAKYVGASGEVYPCRLVDKPAEPGLKKLPVGARVFASDGPRRAPKRHEYFFDPIWGHGVCQALWDYEGDVNVQVCKMLDPALYAIPDGGERIKELEAERQLSLSVEEALSAIDRALLFFRQGDRSGCDGMNEREISLASTAGVKVVRNAFATEQSMHSAWRKRATEAESDAERLRKAIGDAAYTLATGGFAGAIAAQQMLLAALSPSPAPAAESQGNAQHHSEGAKILDGGSGSSAAESEGGKAYPGYYSAVAAMRDERDTLSARLAACEERCRELEAGIEKHRRQHQAIYEELDGAEKFDKELWSLLSPKAGGEYAVL